MDTQGQLDSLTATIEAIGAEQARSGAVFMGALDFLAAKVELMNAVLVPLLAHAEPFAKSAAIAAAQVKGEQLEAEGSPTIAANYARLLAGMLPS